MRGQGSGRERSGDHETASTNERAQVPTSIRHARALMQIANLSFSKRIPWCRLQRARPRIAAPGRFRPWSYRRLQAECDVERHSHEPGRDPDQNTRRSMVRVLQRQRRGRALHGSGSPAAATGPPFPRARCALLCTSRGVSCNNSRSPTELSCPAFVYDPSVVPGVPSVIASAGSHTETVVGNILTSYPRSTRSVLESGTR
jgi:hypothetical protein